ncbi:MAG: hypothetical protein WC553_00675 [Patescibacteria group bacterium]|jgi:hypothetical protein
MLKLLMRGRTLQLEDTLRRESVAPEASGHVLFAGLAGQDDSGGLLLSSG